MHTKKKKVGRPVGSRDKKKRQKRDTLTAKQEMEVVELRKGGLAVCQIAEKMKTTTYVIKYALKRAVEAKKVKRFFNPAAMKERVSEDGCQIGVYALLASSLDRKKSHH